jgi:hypothetical protein
VRRRPVPKTNHDRSDGPRPNVSDTTRCLSGSLARRAAGDAFRARRCRSVHAVATAIFLLAIVHTFVAPKFAALAHRVQHVHDAQSLAAGTPRRPSVRAEILHFLGEIEVVFGLWAAVLLVAVTLAEGWEPAKHYFAEGVNYTEPLFVIVIMALAATRPIITFAEGALRRVEGLGGGTPAAWWVAILTLGPLLGSFITEPAAMTICALLLARQFYDLEPSRRLKFATLGLLFVNVSIGGTLTRFAAPPVLMVARTWEWDFAFMFGHFGWRATLAVTISTVIYFLLFRGELRALADKKAIPEIEVPERTPATTGHIRCCPCPPGWSSRTCCSWPGRSSMHTIPRCSWVDSSSFSGSPRRPRPIRAGSI